MLIKNKIGIGTGGFAIEADEWENEKSSIRFALDIGYTVIDTAQIYGNGNCEILVGESIKGYDRSNIEIITKVLPFDDPVDSLYNSLKRLQVDYVDMYMLHWYENTNMEETITMFQLLMDRKVIHNYGVSNFDQGLLLKWKQLEREMGVSGITANQIHISKNNVVDEELILYHKNNGIITIASSPLDKGVLSPDNLMYAKYYSDLVLVRSKNLKHIEQNYQVFND